MAYQIMLSQAQVELLTELLRDNPDIERAHRERYDSTEHEYHNLFHLLSCF